MGIFENYETSKFKCFEAFFSTCKSDFVACRRVAIFSACKCAVHVPAEFLYTSPFRAAIWSALQLPRKMFSLLKQLSKWVKQHIFGWYVYRLHPLLVRETTVVLHYDGDIEKMSLHVQKCNWKGTHNYARTKWAQIAGWVRYHDGTNLHTLCTQ